MRTLVIAFCLLLLIVGSVKMYIMPTTDKMLSYLIPYGNDNTPLYLNKYNHPDEYIYLKTHLVTSDNHKAKGRTNLVFLGIEEGPRTDSIIFASIDLKSKKAEVISIPRDTYYHEIGFDSGDRRKINAVYGRSGEKGSVNAVGNILCGVPIHHYIALTYDGVEKIVDAMGGVEVDVVPGIEEIEEGTQVLNGKQSVVFLRHRQGYPDGDLGRIKAQQRFIISAAKRLKGSNVFTLLTFANSFYHNMNTDMSDGDLLSLMLTLKGMEISHISMHILPGIPKYAKIEGKNWSYYFPNIDQIEDLINDITQ
jgi:LCP family protein required for cell wall assembly